jgi:DNA modification methylase
LLRRYGTTATWPDGWEGELGHESHPNEFVRHLLHVFDQVWRVLKDDGCLWVNLADTYNNRQGKKGTTNAPDGSNGRFAAGGKGYAESLRQQPEFFKHYIPNIGHKSELGVPFRFHLLFSKRPDYRFDRKAIDIPARSSVRRGDRANCGSVWQTTAQVMSDSDECPDGLWQINPEASPYRHVAMWPRSLVRQMLLPTTRPGDTILDPFAGSGTTGQVAVELGLNAVLIEPSAMARDALTDRLDGRNLALPL